MELHTFAGSPNGRKVEAVIDHLGLEVRIVRHDFPAGLRRPDYLALNPNGLVPTLVDGDLRLWEANAIIQYLADKAGDQALFPREPAKRADVSRWLFWELVHFNRAFGALAFETVARPALGLAPSDPTFVETAKRDLARFAAVLDGHVAGRDTVAGDGISLADYAVITFEAYRSLVPFDFAPYANLNRYFDRMRQQPSWVRTTPARQRAAQAA